MSPRRRNIMLAVLPCAVIVGIFLYWLLVPSRLDIQRQAWRDAGLPATLPELNQWYAYPEGLNPAPMLTEAAYKQKYIPFAEMEELPIVGTWEEPPYGVRWPGETLERARQWLDAEQRALLDKVAQSETSGPGRYDVDFKEGLRNPMSHLAPLRSLATRFELRSAIEAHEGEPHKAAASILSILRIAESLENEPAIISQLVQGAIRGKAFDALARLLALESVPPESAAALAELCKTHDRTGGMRSAIVGQTVCLTDALLHDRQLPTTLQHEFALNEAPHALLVRLYQTAGFNRADAAGIFEDALRTLELDALPFPEKIQRSEEGAEPSEGALTLLSLADLLHIPWRGLFIAEARSIAQLRVMRTALALDQYAQTHRAFPETLAALVPDFLDAVPEDPRTGEPFVYRLDRGGCLIYGLGDNGVDNGGAIHLHGSEYVKRGDIAMHLPLMLE